MVIFFLLVLLTPFLLVGVKRGDKSLVYFSSLFLILLISPRRSFHYSCSSWGIPFETDAFVSWCETFFELLRIPELWLAFLLMLEFIVRKAVFLSFSRQHCRIILGTFFLRIIIISLYDEKYQNLRYSLRSEIKIFHTENLIKQTRFIK